MLLASNINLKFISLNKEYIDLVDKTPYDGLLMKIENYKPQNKDTIVYYVSPANSLGFMDGGIDLPLSRKIMPGIEPKLKQEIHNNGKVNLIGRKYLPIGSSIIVKHNETTYLVSAPTMLLPQNVKNTQNAYYASMAVLHNIIINNKNFIKNKNIEIIFTSMCCGCGKMNVKESLNQTLKAINDYHTYKPIIVNQNFILNEPNLDEQPNNYFNTEWKNINPNNIEIIN